MEGCSQHFIPPRRDGKAIECVSSSSSSTNEEVQDTLAEEIIAEETKNWLSLHGTKLFDLACSKFLVARERKAKSGK